MSILFSQEEKTAIITLDRAQYRNALDIPALKELQAVLEEFESSPMLRAGIITGSGEESFCAGMDLQSLSAQDRKPLNSPFPATLMRGLEITKPLIAAVNGSALGGGLELALCCDLRLAVPEAVFGFPEVTLGIIPGWGGTQRLPRQIPSCLAAQLLLTGKPVDAAEAFRIGLINAVIPRRDLLATAAEWAGLLCRASPLAVRAAKEAMLKGMQLPLEQGLELEDALLTYLKTTADFREGLRAFHEKRNPSFTGI
ncbi:MAG: enoyl-CoA hydratase/isomerase family protein [Dehalococcoidales bacterium]|nr:enoyl-CoA hydratase/isomerase family protein [Dehalococcoidales bacterium]